MAAVLLIFTILISAFFDAMGTSVGLATEAGTIKDGQIENVDKVLLVDAFGSVVGGGASGSANQIFVESATGIGAGARTGFANIVSGVLFLLAIIMLMGISLHLTLAISKITDDMRTLAEEVAIMKALQRQPQGASRATEREQKKP